MADATEILAALQRLRIGGMPTAAFTQEQADTRQKSARASRRRGSGLALNLTPMIDVTFLLLVFFVCTTKSLDQEGLLRADLSERGGIASADAMALDEPPLRIEVQRANGATVIRVLAPLPQPADSEQLWALLTTRRYSAQNPTGLFAADQPIELAPSKEALWEDAVAVFNAITRAGYTRVSFARPR